MGTGKTGTHSIAGLFEARYRAAHEPECEALVSLLLRNGSHRTLGDARRFLRERDSRLRLELESDGTLYYFLDALLEEFEEAKFILTIRDCYSWLDSVFNHILGRRPSGLWKEFDGFQFDALPYRHTPEEAVLAEAGLRTLRHYLRHWQEHNSTVIKKVPPERLLIVRTDRIDDTLAQMAAFLGLDESTLDRSRSHLFKNPKAFRVLSRIPTAFLETAVAEECGDLMRRFFPDIWRPLENPEATNGHRSQERA